MGGADSAGGVCGHSGFHGRAHFRAVVSCGGVREGSPDVGMHAGRSLVRGAEYAQS